MTHPASAESLRGEAQGLGFRQADRRESPRFKTLARAARLVAFGDTGLCRVQDLSNGGAQVETSIETFWGDPVEILFDSKNKVQGRVVWRSGNKTGIRFLPPIDACSFISDLATDRCNAAARPPRLPVNARAEVATELGPVPAVVQDISQKGMKLCHASKLLSGMEVKVSLARGLSARGMVRWADLNGAGIEFYGMLSTEELASARSV